MRLSSYFGLLSALFPAAALAQQAAPAPAPTATATPAAAPVVVPAAVQLQEGTKTTFSVMGNLKYFLDSSAGDKGSYQAFPVGIKESLRDDKIDQPSKGFSRLGGCAAVLDCMSEGNFLRFKTVTTAGPLKIDATIPLLDGNIFDYAYDNRESNQQNSLNLTDAIVRRTLVNASYSEDIFYAKVGSRLQDYIPRDAYAGVKIPVGTDKLDLRMGRWYETTLLLPTEALYYPRTANPETGGFTYPLAGPSRDPFFANGLRAGYETTVAGIGMKPYVAYLNSFEMNPPNLILSTYDQRAVMGGLALNIGLPGDRTVSPEFNIITGSHVITDGGTKGNPAKWDATNKTYAPVAAKAPIPVAVTDVTVMEAKLSYEQQGASVAGHYYVATTGTAKEVKKAAGGVIESGSDISKTDSKVVRTGIDVSLDSTLLNVKDLGTKEGKALLGCNVVNWTFDERQDGMDETDTLVFVGYGTDKISFKFNYENWISRDASYMVDRSGHLTKHWDAFYLSSEFTF